MEQDKTELQRKTYRLWPETAKILGVGKDAVYEAAKRGEIPTIKIGRTILVPRAALHQLLEGGKGEAA